MLHPLLWPQLAYCCVPYLAQYPLTHATTDMPPTLTVTSYRSFLFLFWLSLFFLRSTGHLILTPPPLPLFRTYTLESTGTADRVTQGVHRAVLDWSTGVITKLAAGLLRPAAAAANAASPASSGGGGGSASVGERHARNARRWLSDERVWKAFVRSLEGATAAAEPNTHLPQAASLGVLRAAVFAVRAAAAADAAPVAASGEWALVAIRLLCGVGGGGGTVKTGEVHASVAIDGRGKAPPMAGVASGLELGSMGVGVGVEVEVGQQKDGGVDRAVERYGKRGRGRGGGGGGGARMRMSLDAFMTFLEEAVRGHVSPSVSQRRVGVWDGNGNGDGDGDGNWNGPLALPEKALTELLRFQVVLQGQQNRRKVTLD